MPPSKEYWFNSIAIQGERRYSWFHTRHCRWQWGTKIRMPCTAAANSKICSFSGAGVQLVKKYGSGRLDKSLSDFHRMFQGRCSARPRTSRKWPSFTQINLWFLHDAQALLCTKIKWEAYADIPVCKLALELSQWKSHYGTLWGHLLQHLLFRKSV